jgi:hypothetical protein
MNNLINPEGSGEAGVFPQEETKLSENILYFFASLPYNNIVMCRLWWLLLSF